MKPTRNTLTAQRCGTTVAHVVERGRIVITIDTSTVPDSHAIALAYATIAYLVIQGITDDATVYQPYRGAVEVKATDLSTAGDEWACGAVASAIDNAAAICDHGFAVKGNCNSFNHRV